MNFLGHLEEKDVESLCMALGEPGWAQASRRASFQRMGLAAHSEFRFGSSIILKPDLSFSKLFIRKKASIKVHTSNTEHLEVLHGQGFGILGSKLHDRFSKVRMDGKIGLFNEAFTNSTIFVKVPKKISGSPAIITLEIDSDSADPTAVSVFILAEPDSLATIVFRKISSGKKKAPSKGTENYIGVNFKVLALDGSRINIVNIQDFGQSIVSFEERKAEIADDARVNWVDLCVGSSYSSSSIVSNLAGEGASTGISFLYAAKASQKFDVYTSAVHKSPHTQSNILTRGVVNDSAKVLSRGLIVIGKDAFASQGFEKQDALLLSEGAEADAIPNLEISNHDVKCSHGSTVGQIDSEKIFYLMSRGLSEDDAKRMVVKGYFAPILEIFKEDERVHLEDTLEQAINS